MTSENLPTLLFESFQAHDLDRWYQALSDDFEASYPNARQGLNKEDALAYNQPFEKAFSDFRFKFSDSATSGDITYHAGMRKLPMTVRLHWARNRLYLQQATRYSCQALSWSG